jgi:hypothetical protein
MRTWGGADLAATVFRYLNACVEVGAAQEEDETSAARAKVLAAQHRMLEEASTLATLATAEGCAGLGPSLAVRGFGGEVTVRADEAADSMPVAWENGEPRAFPHEDENVGRDERLAYRLCASVPHTTAFVAAGPGQLAAVSSDDEHVRWTTDLSVIGRARWGP